MAAWKAFVSRNLQSVRFMACPSSPSGEALRQFWLKSYPEIKALNPRFPFLLRPAPESEPYMLVEYDFAQMTEIPLSGLNEAQIEEKLKEAVIKGESTRRAYHQSVEPLLQPAVVE